MENNLHWQVDVSFNEDRRRIRKGHGAERVGIAGKRKCCAWDNHYVLRVLAQ